MSNVANRQSPVLNANLVNAMVQAVSDLSQAKPPGEVPVVNVLGILSPVFSAWDAAVPVAASLTPERANAIADLIAGLLNANTLWNFKPAAKP